MSARPIVLARPWGPADLPRPAETVCSMCSGPVVIHRALAAEVRAKPHLHQVVCHDCWERYP